MKLQMSFGENLINLRKQKGWSQDDLAENLDLSRQAISKWENDTSKPDIDNIKKISKIFSVTIDDLLNNDVVKDKAVTLNVKKEEKKERITTIVKCMIIAVIIIYIINVIFKFASLLIIVNGIQKYANLSNYHYVITTYENNELIQKEECWFKDGISRTKLNLYSENNDFYKETIINYNQNTGYSIDENGQIRDIDIEEFLSINRNYENGAQFFSKIPVQLREVNYRSFFFKCFSLNNFSIEVNNNFIDTRIDMCSIIFDKENFQPISVIFENKDNDDNIITMYNLEKDVVEQI